jgi:predicted transcriptional regulator
MDRLCYDGMARRTVQMEALGAMSVSVTITLDDRTGAYLERIAADQNRDPAEVAAWILTADLQREQAIDHELIAQLDTPADDRVMGQAPRRASA